MSEEQLKAFLAKVKADTGLQEKLKAASDSDAVVAIAKDAGFNITANELNRTRNEVSDQELEGVAGGGFFDTTPIATCKRQDLDIETPGMH